MTFSLFDGYNDYTNPTLFRKEKINVPLDIISEKLNKYILPLIELFNTGEIDKAINLVIENRDKFMMAIENIKTTRHYVDYIDIILIFISSSYDLLAQTGKRYLNELDINSNNKAKLDILNDKDKLLEDFNRLNNVASFTVDTVFVVNETMELKPEIEIYMKRFPHLIKMGIYDKLKINEIKNEIS